VRSTIFSKGAPQNFAALARRGGFPLGLRLGRRPERGKRVVRRGVGDLAQRLGGRGVLHGECLAPGGVAPLAADVQPLLYAINDGQFGSFGGHEPLLSFWATGIKPQASGYPFSLLGSRSRTFCLFEAALTGFRSPASSSNSPALGL
jgi:hypothetical protein